MILELRLQSVLSIIATAMVILILTLTLFAMTPAVAASQQPCHAGDVEASNHHDTSKAPSSCCDDMHCCPVLTRLPAPGVRGAVRYQPHAYLKAEQALLLMTSIDPPPRTPAL
ncbi:Hypothetical protein NGAL_HAMBI2610_36060 [Neorhizobium galegae bv. orientalis]|nr:Hypothetical protein NGAL_HAMBI2610_36060 [Neorhizobium galegae bv. orientalis]